MISYAYYYILDKGFFLKAFKYFKTTNAHPWRVLVWYVLPHFIGIRGFIVLTEWHGSRPRRLMMQLCKETRWATLSRRDRNEPQWIAMKWMEYAWNAWICGLRGTSRTPLDLLWTLWWSCRPERIRCEKIVFWGKPWNIWRKPLIHSTHSCYHFCMFIMAVQSFWIALEAQELLF